MSGPADLTPGCPVCGRAWQARGCEPGACKSDPDGLGTSVAHGSEERITVGVEELSTSRLEVPLVDPPPGQGMLVRRRRRPRRLRHHRRAIGAQREADLPLALPYVRAVTERARALDEALREAVAWLDDPSAYWQAGAPREFDARVEELLADIDKAKTAGRDG